MDKFQSGTVLISFASLAIYVFLSIAGVEKSSKWIKWYWQMDEKNRKKYDPQIAMRRIRKVLVIMFAVGISGFLLSLLIRPEISMITFGVIVVMLILSIGYTGPRNCLIEKKHEYNQRA